MSEHTVESDARQIATLLGEHRLGHRDRHSGPFGGPFRCTCDRWAAVIVADGRDGDGVSMEDQHRAHVAAALVAEGITLTRVTPPVVGRESEAGR